MSKNELRSQLTLRGWGAKDAAFHFQINVRTVQRWLSGHRKIPPSVDLWFDVCPVKEENPQTAISRAYVRGWLDGVKNMKVDKRKHKA